MSGYPSKFGKYLLLERVNVGGMAEVFKAKTFGVAGFERILAIKRILPSLVEDDEFIRMFIDEARIAVQLNHPNIVQIYELGKHGEHYYIAMEYLASRDLRGILDRLRLHGQLMPIPQAAFVTSKVCEGLHYAHRKADPTGNPMGIIHRDVSPQNVLVSYEGEIKIIDFGIAKAANRASKTQAGVLKGKFGYMSPEQVRGLPIDRRSDIFAVGVLLYEMLTGERLFVGESDFSTLERVRNAEVPPPTTFNKKISPELEAIVLKSLAREVEDRYQWASELADDLQRFLIEDRSIYSPKRLAAYMKEAYAEEISNEQSKQEAFLSLSPEDLKKKRAPVSDEAKVDLDAPLEDGSQTIPPDGIEWDEADDFEDGKTFVIEASEAGQVLGAAEALAAGANAPPEEAAPVDSHLTTSNPHPAKGHTNDDFLADASLYGDEGLEDDDDDAKTQVSFANPFDENAGADAAAPSVNSVIPPTNPAAEDEDKTVVRVDSVAAQPALKPPAGEIVRPNAPTAMMPAVQPDQLNEPAPDDETVVGATVPPPDGAVPLGPPGSPTALLPAVTNIPMPAAANVSGPGPAASSAGAVSGAAVVSGAAIASGAAPVKPKAAVPKGCVAAMIAAVLAGFIGLVAAVITVVMLLGDDGGTATLQLAAVDGADEAEVFVDGDKIDASLPAAVEVSSGEPHEVKVAVKDGAEWTATVPSLPPDAELALTPAFANDSAPDETSDEKVANAAPPDGGAKPEATPDAQPENGEKVAAADDDPAAKDAPEGAKGDEAGDDAKVDAAGPAAQTMGLAALGADDEKWRISFAAVHRDERQAIQGAKVYMGDDLIGFTPFERDFPASMDTVKLRVRAEGFKSKKVRIARNGRDAVGPATVELRVAGEADADEPTREGTKDEDAKGEATGKSKSGDKIAAEDDVAADGENNAPADEDDKKDAPASDKAASNARDDDSATAEDTAATKEPAGAKASDTKTASAASSKKGGDAKGSDRARAGKTKSDAPKTSSKSTSSKSTSSKSTSSKSTSSKSGRTRGTKSGGSGSSSAKTKKTAKAPASKASATLGVGSRPRGMKVFIDKKMRGQTPLLAGRGFSMAVGSHFMMLTDPKTNKTYKFRFKITKGGQEVKIIFDANKGKVTTRGPISASIVK